MNTFLYITSAVKLSREACFGEEVLAKRTGSGLTQVPVLPPAERNQLKHNSEIWSNHIGSESVWAASEKT